MPMRCKTAPHETFPSFTIIHPHHPTSPPSPSHFKLRKAHSKKKPRQAGRRQDRPPRREKKEEAKEKAKKRREETKYALICLSDEWFAEKATVFDYDYDPDEEDLAQEPPTNALVADRILLQRKQERRRISQKADGTVVTTVGRNAAWPMPYRITQEDDDAFHAAHETYLGDAQLELAEYGDSIGSCLMCGQRRMAVTRLGGAGGAGGAGGWEIPKSEAKTSDIDNLAFLACI